MALLARAYWCPKSSGVRSEWEDGFALSEVDGIMAVSDGATWSPRSGDWANSLAFSYMTDRTLQGTVSSEAFIDWISQLSKSFNMPAPSDDVPAANVEQEWWADGVRAKGAAAAFVGLRFDLRQREWAAVGVGDCCLFHFSPNHRPVAFPLERPDQFHSSPTLINSSAHLVSDEIAMCSGSCAVGDLFILASDALSSWVVGELHRPEWLAMTLASIRSSNFGPMVTQLRAAGSIPDDDVTLVRCHVQEPRPR